MSASDTSDVDQNRSFLFNMKPYNTGDTERDTVYLHEGMRLDFHLDPVLDPEDGDIRVEVRDAKNYFWNVWATKADREPSHRLQSDPIRIGINVELGTTNLTISFVDPVTGARTNLT